MMREILFRGKRIDNGEWVEGGYRHEKKGEYYTSVFIIEHLTSGVWENHRVVPATVGQYTGLTDKNGKKIFEGDIISIPFEEDRSPWEENCIYYENGEVYFDAEHHGWYVRFFDNEELSIWEYDELEVLIIGNIHDNPEWLKGGAKQ